MRWLKLTVAYDGTHYFGWQAQAGQPSVQEAFERALTKVTGETRRVTASGRTDTGVHALGQVVSFPTQSRLTASVLQRALNAELPRDILVLSAAESCAGFDASRDAIRKRYRYMIHNDALPDLFRRQYTWHVAMPLDDQAMHQAAQALMGTHDFRSFEASGGRRRTSVRTVSHIAVHRGAGEGAARIAIDIQADGFLYRMVRIIVGTLVEVGRGARPVAWPAEVLRAADRTRAGPTAPPHGLFLVDVEYA
jgi:tRNA pseudouridine38-40 synthase